MKNILSGQTMDTATTCAGGQSIPPPSLSNNRVSFVFFFLKKKRSSCGLKNKWGSSGGFWTFFSMAQSFARRLGEPRSLLLLDILGKEEESFKNDVSYSHCCVGSQCVCVCV